MIPLDQIITFEKLQNDESFMRNIQSFFASLAIYAAFVGAGLYCTTSHPILLPKSEGRITISLSEFAPVSNDIEHIVQPPMQTTKAQNKILQPTTPQGIPLLSPSVSPERFTPPAISSAVSSISDQSPDDLAHLSVSNKNENEPSKNTNSSKEIEDALLGRIRAMIENAITYPAIARKLRLEGEVLAFFILNPDGTVETAKVKSTSGSDMLDTKAIQTILSLSGRYPALGKTFELSIPIAFSLKKS
ncbi:MAG: TonB family protein [Sulfurovaceae bacterium]|nr:TonB family protein [Sulfurovaceae bacterium]